MATVEAKDLVVNQRYTVVAGKESNAPSNIINRELKTKRSIGNGNYELIFEAAPGSNRGPMVMGGPTYPATTFKAVGGRRRKTAKKASRRRRTTRRR